MGILRILFSMLGQAKNTLNHPKGSSLASQQN